MKISNAYRCDGCGTIMEGRAPFCITSESEWEFTIRTSSQYSSIEKTCCSVGCALDVGGRWGKMLEELAAKGDAA